MRVKRILALFWIACLSASGLQAAASSNRLVRVPQDARTLDAAIARVADGGVIEMAAGTYPSPPNGFTINNARKGFTVRAAGGAVKAITGSSATFINCSFRGNSSSLRGGALVVRDSDATVQGGEFAANRTNLPGHNPNSFGGAIAVIDGTLSVAGTRFDGNQAGWVGGAIFAIGNWDRGSSVFVTRSTFTGNQAVADPCCVNPAATSGGAIHAEDLTALRVHDSLFQGNRAEIGGGVDGYRADIEVDGSVFQANGGTGGAVAVVSADSADASTGNGAINRRAARLVIDQSLIQGGGDTPPATAGCILASGDVNRMYGGGGVSPAGTLADNRAPVEIRGSVLSGCAVETAADGSGGLGGALDGSLIDLDLEDSMVLDSAARGTGAGGGGLSLRQESNARIVNTTFAHDTADKWGGALLLSGSTVQVDGCRFYGNDVVPGASEPLSESRGAAIYSIPFVNPARPRSVGGVVANSVFSENLGIPIWDVDPQGGPINGMRYDGNRFAPQLFGNLVYVDTLAAPSGASAVQLNSLTVYHGALGTTAKSAAPNTQVFNPSEGALLIVPSPNGVGAGATAPTASELAYAWTGDSAAIGTIGLAQKTGLLEVPPGDYSLTIDRTPAATAKATGSCTAGPYLCLAGNRFRAEVTWKNGAAAAPAQAVSISGDTGSFWFVDPANVELVVKVLDGRGINGSFWVFYGGLTNLAYTLTITDTVTGAVKVYTNPAGRFASAGDTSAFPAPAGAVAASATAELSSAAASDLEVEGKATCAAGPANLCLNASRFEVEITWKDPAGRNNTGHAVPLSGDTGYFWFTSPDNVEVIVKVLDGRGLNGHFWVFYGALSNLGYTLTVTDTQTGAKKSYTNPAGRFASAGDTTALPGS